MMGNPIRCPKCNRLGSKERNGVCRRCDMDAFKDTVMNLTAGSPKVLQTSLLEFGAKKVDDIKHIDRSGLINMLKRRVPNERSGHIARKNTKLETYGHAPLDEKEAGIIKGVAEIVRMG